MPVVHVFVYLQLLDFLTTLAGFKVGAHEASPFIVTLIHSSSPAFGVAASKIIALAIGGVCVAADKARLIGWINYWYAALVVWNLCMIITASHRFGH
jgi:Domain of unknown function (DUF5658)